MLNVDYRALISRADLVYHSPAEVSIDGTPIGNGMMGTTVWTTPNSARFHLNRRDIFSTDRNHAGCHKSPVDYRGGCARIEIDVGEAALTASDNFQQRLSLYDAECTINGDGVRLRCFISSQRDLLAVEVDDQREQPMDIRVTLSMWRAQEVTVPLNLWNAARWTPEEVETGTHTTRYRFSQSKDRIAIVQEFKEMRYFRDEEYRASSAAVIAVDGVDGFSLEAHEASWKPAPLLWDEKPLGITNERNSIANGVPEARSFVLSAATGIRTIFVSTASSHNSTYESVETDALSVLDDIGGNSSYDTLCTEHVAWWHAFWSRSFVHITSPDGFADYLERVRTLHLYYSASSSRGPGPAPQGAGLIFQTEGDIPHLGTQLWHWIVEMMYRPLLAADAADLCEPYFDMYVGQLPACEKAAQQRWGLGGGILYPETSPTDGPTLLPDDCANEFREFFLGRSSSDALSVRTRVLCQHDSHLYYSSVFDDSSESHQGLRPYASIAHIVSTGSKIALHAWWRYRCTGDKAWLREKAYPLLRGTIELYRHLATRGEDGFYHLQGTNVMESFYLVNDSLKDLAAIRGTAGPAIRAAEILSVDAELREQWKDLLDHLAPYPMGSDPKARALTFGVLSDDVWAAGYLGDINLAGIDYPSEDVWVHPIETFETWTLESNDVPTDAIVERLIDLCPNHVKVMTGLHWRPSLVRTPIAFALAGRGEDLPSLLAAHYSMYAPHLSNGLSCFEQGIQAMGLEPSGMASVTIQHGLMQSLPPAPGEPEIIRVFPAWPKQWGASFSLLARGGFLVTSSIVDGVVEFVEIESRIGEECRLRNPWGRSCTLRCIDGSSVKGAETLSGNLFCFKTDAGKRYQLLPLDRKDSSIRTISPKPSNGPVRYTFELPSGVTVKGQIGRGRNDPNRGFAAYETGNRRMRVEQRLLVEERSR